jgi:hypothetical protein
MSILSLHNPTTYGENYTHTYQPTVYDSYTMVGVIVCLPYHTIWYGMHGTCLPYQISYLDSAPVYQPNKLVLSLDFQVQKNDLKTSCLEVSKRLV